MHAKIAMTIILSLALGLSIAVLHLAAALGSLNSSQMVRGLGISFAVVVFGFAVLTWAFGLRSLRKLLLITALGPTAILDAYLLLHSRPAWFWLAVFAATAVVAALSVFLFGQICDRRHRMRSN